MVDGVFHLGGCPFAGFVIESKTGRPNHDETVHEGIVDRALQAMPFAKLAVLG